MMAGLWKYFQRQSLPNTKETGLGEVITNEANAAWRESWRKSEMGHFIFMCVRKCTWY